MAKTLVRDQDKFLMRLPDGLREDIKAAAKINERSMNSEIVARLETSPNELRADLAGRAMQGILAGYWSNSAMGGVSPHMIANEAVQHADALISELEKGGDA